MLLRPLAVLLLLDDGLGFEVETRRKDNIGASQAAFCPNRPVIHGDPPNDKKFDHVAFIPICPWLRQFRTYITHFPFWCRRIITSSRVKHATVRFTTVSEIQMVEGKSLWPWARRPLAPWWFKSASGLQKLWFLLIAMSLCPCLCDSLHRPSYCSSNNSGILVVTSPTQL